MSSEFRPKLQIELQDAGLQLTSEDFGYHATDLYVRARPGVVRWLVNNYEFWNIVTRFTCPVNDPALQAMGVRELWLDVPFAGFWPNDNPNNRMNTHEPEHKREAI